MTKTKTTKTAKTADESRTAVPPASFAMPTKEEIAERKAAKSAQRAELQAKQADMLKGYLWHPRSPGLLPNLPDRDLLPQVDDVLASYDKAQKIVARARELQDRRTELPALIKAAEASYIDEAATATTQGKTLPKLDEVSDLKSELDVIDASVKGVEKAAWTAFRDWGNSTKPHMKLLIEPTLDELDDALSALSAASAAVDREIERIRHAQGTLGWARDDDFRPSYPKTPTPELVEASRLLSSGLSRLTRYAELVREEA